MLNQETKTGNRPRGAFKVRSLNIWSNDFVHLLFYMLLIQLLLFSVFLSEPNTQQPDISSAMSLSAVLLSSQTLVFSRSEETVVEGVIAVLWVQRVFNNNGLTAAIRPCAAVKWTRVKKHLAAQRETKFTEDSAWKKIQLKRLTNLHNVCD